METNIYELLMVAIPYGSVAQERIYEAIEDTKVLAIGMQIDLENDTEEKIEELMMTIVAEGGKKYGLQAE